MTVKGHHVHSIYNKDQKTFHAGVGFTSNPASVYRYSRSKATSVLEKLRNEGEGNGELVIVSYAFVFELLGTPGNRKKKDNSLSAM